MPPMLLKGCCSQDAISVAAHPTPATRFLVQARLSEKYFPAATAISLQAFWDIEALQNPPPEWAGVALGEVKDAMPELYLLNNSSPMVASAPIHEPPLLSHPCFC